MVGLLGWTFVAGASDLRSFGFSGPLVAVAFTGGWRFGTLATPFMGLRDKRLVFLVDAEDPRNEDTFPPPSEPVKDFPERWEPEFAGDSTFKDPDRDEWDG